MANEMITQLPTVTNASLTDIIYAVQGYISPSSPGLSVQETLGQVAQLMSSQIILSNAGDPNGAVAGNIYQLCYDTINKILYVCTSSGSSITAVWTNFVSTSLIAGPNISLDTNSTGTTITATGLGGFVWNEVLTTSQAMTSNNGYVTNNASQVILSLPIAATFGDEIDIIGKGAGGWLVQCGAGQTIVFGNTTTSSGGSLASTNAKDSFYMVCTVTDTEWTVASAPEGNLTVA